MCLEQQPASMTVHGAGTRRSSRPQRRHAVDADVDSQLKLYAVTTKTDKRLH